MVRISNVAQITSGSPQFRLYESFDKQLVPYYYYGQAELEADLAGITNNEDAKQIRTKDKVNLIKEGDVIFSLVSGKAAIVRQSHNGYLYTQNYLKITPKAKLDASYLVYLLNENSAIKRQFYVNLQSSAVRKYSVGQVRELTLPALPVIKKQRLIGKLYFQVHHLNALKKRAAELEIEIALESLKGISDE